jgi:hypothetical protein
MTTPIWQPLAEEQTPPTPPNKKKRHWVRWTLAGAGATVLALTVVGIAASGSTTGTPTAQPSSAAPAWTGVPAATVSSPPAPTPTAQDFTNLAPGTPVLITQDGGDAAAVNVKKITVTTTPADPSYGSAPANGYYVIVKVSATTLPDFTKGFDINALDFYALDGAGNQSQEGNGNAFDALSNSQSNTDITATLGAGQTSTGWEAFDVSSPHGTIVYAPNFDGQPLGSWKF